MVAIAWHYTVGVYLDSILRDKKIKLETGTRISDDERLCVWFTRAKQYEKTAYKSIQYADGTIVEIKDPLELSKSFDGLIRIGVDAKDLKTFDQWEQQSKTPKKLRDVLLSSAQEMGSNPYRHWMVSFKPVVHKRWIKIQKSIDNQIWADIPL